MGRQVKDQLTGQTYNFPDDATDEQISESMASMHPVQAAAAPSSQQNVAAQSEQPNNFSFKDEASSLLGNLSGKTGNFFPGVGDVAFRNPVSNIRDAAQGAISAPAKLGQTLVDATFPTLRRLGIDTPYMKDVENFDWNKFTSPIGSGEDSPGQKAAQSIGSSLLFAPLGGRSILGQIVSGGLQQASEAKKGEQNLFGLLPSGKKGAFIEGAGLNAVPGAGLKILEKLRPSNVLRGTLTPDELRDNVRIAGDSPTGLGNVIGNTRLTRQMENIIGHVPFSGQSQVEEQAKDFVSNQGKKILESTAGTADIEDSAKNIASKAQNVASKVLGTKDVGASEQELQDKAKSVLDQLSQGQTKQDIESSIQNTVGDVFNEQNEAKKQIYKSANETADNDKNFRMEAPAFEAAAPEKNKIIDSVLSSDKGARDAYDKLRGAKFEKEYIDAKTLTPVPKKRIYPSLQEANLLKATLNKHANILNSSPDPLQRNQAGILGNLASHIDAGINDSINNSGNKVLRRQFDEAQQNYGKNFAPLLDKDIYKMIPRPGNKFDSDTLSNSIVKTGGSSDRGNLASKMQRILGPRDTRLAYSYLSPAINQDTGAVNLDALGSKFGKLGPKQRNALINDRSLSKSLIEINKQNERQKILRPAIQQGGEIDPKALASIARKQAVPSGILPEKSKAMLSEYEKAHALHEIFSPAMGPDGKVNSAKLDSIITKLQQNPVEFERRVPDPEMRKRMSDFVKLNRWNSKSQKLNPPTGQKVLDYLPFLMGHMGGAALGGIIGSVPGSIVGALAPATLARPLVRAMTSPAVRRNFVSKMIENKKLFDRPGNVIPAQTLSQALVNSNRGNQ